MDLNQLFLQERIFFFSLLHLPTKVLIVSALEMKNERLEKTQPNSQVWSCGESVCCPELVLWRGQGEARSCKSRLISTRTENEHQQFCWP